jgi:hypothetical protein
LLAVSLEINFLPENENALSSGRLQLCPTASPNLLRKTFTRVLHLMDFRFLREKFSTFHVYS